MDIMLLGFWDTVNQAQEFFCILQLMVKFQKWLFALGDLTWKKVSFKSIVFTFDFEQKAECDCIASTQASILLPKYNIGTVSPR